MPRVSPLHSQVAFRSQSSGAVFNIAVLRKVFTGPAETPCPSRFERSLCPAFQRLSFGRPSHEDRQSRPSVLMHSSNRYPLGNCDSPKPETSLNYLTQLEAASHRFLSPSSFFRVTDTRERARGTGESCLRSRTFRSGLRGAKSTSLTQPFPSHLGLSVRELASNFRFPPTISFFQ